MVDGTAGCVSSPAKSTTVVTHVGPSHWLQSPDGHASPPAPLELPLEDAPPEDPPLEEVLPEEPLPEDPPLEEAPLDDAPPEEAPLEEPSLPPSPEPPLPLSFLKLPQAAAATTAQAAKSAGSELRGEGEGMPAAV
jgi:hypothetical protein